MQLYENKSYENIKQELLNNINLSLNKSEGSFLNDMVSPIALKFKDMFIELDKTIDLTLVDKIVGEFVDRRVSDYGIERKKGTKAKTTIRFTGNQDIEILEGTLVQSAKGLIYKTVQSGKIENNYVDIETEAENVGSIYNISQGLIINLPISINGIISVSNIVDAVGGTDIETDDSLLKRYFDLIQNPATSGNEAHYKIWANSIDGVGDSKVFPTWNGAGSVKVLVIDSNKMPANEAIISSVESYIETVRPVGAIVTVEAPSVKNINISAKPNISSSSNLQTVTQKFSEQLNKYIKDLAFSGLEVSYAKIGSLLLGIEGVIDYSDLKVNNNTVNVPIEDTEIASVGTISLT